MSKAVINTATYLGINRAKLAHILGVSASTVAKLYTNDYILSPAKREWNSAVLLVRLFRSLDSIIGGVSDDASKWLASENKAFGGEKPIDLLESTEGLLRVVTYLDTSCTI